MFCSKCGFENTDGSKFCRKCGNSLTQPHIASAEISAPVTDARTEPQSDISYNHTAGTSLGPLEEAPQLTVEKNKKIEVASRIEMNVSDKVYNNESASEPSVYATPISSVDEYENDYIRPNPSAYSDAASEHKAEKNVEGMYNFPENVYDNDVERIDYSQEEISSAAYCGETNIQPSAAHEKKLPDMGFIVKNSLKSFVFLLSTILFSFAVAMFAISAVPKLISSFVNLSDQWLTCVSMFGIIILLVAVTIGLWLSFLTSLGKGKCKTSGIAVLLFAGVLACTISAGFLTATVYSTVFETITHGLEDIKANIPDISVLFVVLIFSLIFYSKIVSTLSGCRKAARTGVYPGKASVVLPVFFIIYGLFVIALPVILSFVQHCNVSVLAFISCFSFGLSAIMSGINTSVFKASINRIKRS